MSIGFGSVMFGAAGSALLTGCKGEGIFIEDARRLNSLGILWCLIAAAAQF